MNIYTVLRLDHARIDALLDQLRDGKARTPGARRRIVAELREAVRAHERAEEQSIFPLLLRDVEAHDEAVRAREDQRDAESALDELARLEPDDARYGRKMAELDALLRSHFFREEQRLVPRASEILTEAEADLFARRVNTDRWRASR